MSKRKARPERFMLRVSRGALIPADAFTLKRLRDKNYQIGDIISAELRKPRNPAFYRKAHVLGQMAADNIEAFTGMEAHQVLKRLQLEANIGCDEVAYNIRGHGMVVQRIPRSLAFDEMDEGEFNEIYRAFCKHISDTYWPGLEPEQVAEMAELMPEAA